MADSRKKQLVLILCATAIVLSLIPTTARACECLDRLLPWNWCRNTTATASTYAPAYSVQYPVATQTCCYVPQTCYQTVAQTVPTTVYYPSTYCDPCTGCATTCYSPVTSYVRSAQLVPYTTYTPVWTSSCYSPCATVSCGSGCGPSTCGTTYGSTTSGCGSCGTPAASSTLVPAPMQGTTTVPSDSGSGAAQPALPSGTPPATYKQDKPIKPVPEEDIRESSHSPRLEGPSLDRVTVKPFRSREYQPVSYTADADARFEYGGWRASNK